MKKSYSVVALVILAWLLSSCDSGVNPNPPQPSVRSNSPQVLSSDSATPQASLSDPAAQPSPVDTPSSDSEAVSQALTVAQA